MELLPGISLQWVKRWAILEGRGQSGTYFQAQARVAALGGAKG
jgi:hypothetical protein